MTERREPAMPDQDSQPSRTAQNAWLQNARRRELLALGVIALLALAIRVAWLGSIPGNITADEADNLKTIFSIQTRSEPGFFGLDWKPQPAMSMYLVSGFMQIFGQDIFGMRMASAVLSTLALLPFYALARRVVGPLAALGGAALLASGLWYLNFSRSGWENVHVALYALVAAWAFTVARERRQLRWFALAGAACALGLYGYFAGRFIIVALLAYAPVALWQARGYRWRIVAGYAVMTLTALLLFAPQVPAIKEDSGLFNRRTDRVNVFNRPKPYHGEDTNLGILKMQIERNAKGFLLFDGEVFTKGRYGPEGKSLYDPITGGLMLGGLAVSLLLRRQGTSLWWFMLFIPLLGTQIPTTATPDGARALIAAPFMYLYVALALDWLIGFAARHARRVALAGAVAGVALLAVFNVYSYFTWIQSPSALEAREPAVELSDYDAWRRSVIEDYTDRAGRHDQQPEPHPLPTSTTVRLAQ